MNWNTRGVEPTSHVLDITNIMRDDLPQESLAQKQALANRRIRRQGISKCRKSSNNGKTIRAQIKAVIKQPMRPLLHQKILKKENHV